MHRSMRRLAALLMACFIAIAFGLTYWQMVRADALIYSPYNARLAEQEKEIIRGRMLDRNGRVLVASERTPKGTDRRYADPTAAPVTGYYSLRYGTSGLESSFERYLRGEARANPIEALAGEMLHRPRVGDDLHLTLDSKLQDVAARALGSDKGAIVALDPHTGAVLALASSPTFDPNRLDERWEQLRVDSGKPLLNRATQGLYTPGSSFKIVTASAAIDLGLVDLNKSYTCSDDLVVDGFMIKNKNHPGLFRVTFVDDFAYSCNVTFAKTGLGLGTNPLPVGNDLPDPRPWDKSIEESRRRFLDYTGRFGLDAPLPFDLPTSVSSVGNKQLDRVALANTAFGQGELQVTPLLMALASATVANGGKMPRPYLVAEITDPAGNVVQRHPPGTIRDVMSPESARSMNRLMVTSVNEGYAKPAAIPGMEVGGKTGSAEVGPDLKTHSWFIGYAPANDPAIAVAVIMENKGSGTDFATPAGRQVMEAALGR